MYQIVKGWPSNAALDENVKAATGQTIVEGQVITKDSDGAAVVASLAAGDDKTAYFVIGKETLTGTFTGLTGKFIAEVDADHLAAAVSTYAIDELLTATTGKFAALTAGAPEQAIARVVGKDAVNGKLRVIWLG
ncbi:MAG: hypothetical protein LHW56_01555 [Candidatus Cloacimonetes bacterium]|nr:hypothetical protein [Candidatus Cloacimonadota bacterium]MDY0171573.1 hypothetical protein [Candidatus Cloacimonadaceae bacterium]